MLFHRDWHSASMNLVVNYDIGLGPNGWCSLIPRLVDHVGWDLSLSGVCVYQFDRDTMKGDWNWDQILRRSGWSKIVFLFDAQLEVEKLACPSEGSLILVTSMEGGLRRPWRRWCYLSSQHGYACMGQNYVKNHGLTIFQDLKCENKSCTRGFWGVLQFVGYRE